jgi:type I restriction enzyme S subunit
MRSERRTTVTKGRPATTAVISGRYALSVGEPELPAPEGWQWTALGEVARLETGHTPSRKKPEFWGGDVPWIGIGDAADNHGRVIYDTTEHTNERGIAHSSARLLPTHTVCLSRTASVGYIVVMGRPMATSQDFVNWVCSERIDWRFLKYVLLAEQDSLLRFASGTTHQTIYFPEVKAFHVCLPPVVEQRRIADAMEALDDKIDSNRRLAGLLEDSAATLFRARFVDFVGVEELASSELGPIPKGWSVGGVYEIGDVTYGRPFKSELFNATDGVPLIRIRDLATNQPSVVTTEERDDARLIRPGDIVVGMDGEFRAYAWAGPDAWLNQRVCAFDPRDGVSRVFLLESIKKPLQFFEATKGGTTVIHLGKRDIDTFRVVLPPASAMRRFAAEADPLLGLAVALRTESRTLAFARDTLLPKLVSGQIRVRDTTDPDALIGPLAERAV